MLCASVATARKTIHVLPHSHDDVGWLKTFTEYFDGQNKDTQNTNVHIELSTIVDSLLANPERKFTEVEIQFFSLWWDLQTKEKHDQVRELVKRGQLEFVNSGWSMHDEACPTYTDMINNMMRGQQWVLENIGVAPSIGWQIDPFGHSNANARLFHEMGFNAMFFGRMD